MATIEEPLTEQILRAASELAGHQRGVRVQLDKVRARFPHVPRADQDEALRALHFAGRGILMRNDGGIGTASGPTPSEQAAALPLAFTPRHIMYVEDHPAALAAAPPANPEPAAPAKPAAKKRAAKKPRGELQTIVLAWPEEESELVRAGRVDLGERATFRTVIRGKAAMWLREGTAEDIAKATLQAKRPMSSGGGAAGQRVFLFPTTEPDPLGKARAAIERDAQKPPAVQTSAAKSSRPPISLRIAKPPRAATPTHDSTIYTRDDGVPFAKPERAAFKSDADYLRAFHEYKDNRTNAANDAFVKAFNAGLKRAPLKIPAKKTPPIRAKKPAAKKAKASATITRVREQRIDEAIARATARLCRAAARKTAKTRRGLSRRKP